MTDHATSPPPGYETSRVHVGAVFKFILGFILTMAILIALVMGMESKLENPARPAAIILPAEPLPQPLQPSPDHPSLPWQDLAAMRAQQQQRLHSAGPGHIPIEQAMDQLLNSGALTRPWQNPATMPYLRPLNETPSTRSVENHT